MFSRHDLNQLYRYSLSLIGNEQDAYDLLHASIEKYLKYNNAEIRNPIAYMKRIIRNQFIDTCRRRERVDEEVYDETVLYMNMDIESLDITVGNKLQMSEIWKSLNSSEREIMYLWAVEGYTTSELAEYLEVSRGTLLSKIHRLRKRITANYHDEYVEGVR